MPVKSKIIIIRVLDATMAPEERQRKKILRMDRDSGPGPFLTLKNWRPRQMAIKMSMTAHKVEPIAVVVNIMALCEGFTVEIKMEAASEKPKCTTISVAISRLNIRFFVKTK